MKPKGWRNESRRHSLASKGIKTAQKMPKTINKPTIFSERNAKDGTMFKIQKTGLNWTLFVKEKNTNRWDKIQSAVNALELQQIMDNQKEFR